MVTPLCQPKTASFNSELNIVVVVVVFVVVVAVVVVVFVVEHRVTCYLHYSYFIRTTLENFTFLSFHLKWSLTFKERKSGLVSFCSASEGRVQRRCK